MAERKRITLKDVRGLQAGETAWDAGVTGFYARRQQSEAVTFGLFYRTAAGRQRFLTIGRFGAPWTPDTARTEAKRLLGNVVGGRDPAGEKQAMRRGATVAELCAQYLADAEAGRILVRGGKPKKPLTLASDRGRIEDHVIPLLGAMKVSAVTRDDVENMMHAIAEGATVSERKGKPRGVSRVRGGRGVATRTIGLLGAIFAYAVAHHMRQDNPAHGIRKYAENKRARRLSEGEYAMLGTGLGKAEAAGMWPSAVACARFLALTGWRSGEALNLRWQDLDLARRTAHLPDTKAGKSMRPLSHAACALLAEAPRVNSSERIFPASRGDGPMTGFKKFFRKIVAMGGLPAEVTPHVLRHSFASLAADLEYSESTIGALVGHKSSSVTGRYVHSADAVLLAAADAIAARIAELMGDAAPSPEVVELRRA